MEIAVRGSLPTQQLEVDGLRLRASIHGRGRPLLLLNGIGASFELLEPLRRAAAATETIAIDAPGTGGSEPMKLPRPLGCYADVFARALDVLGYGEVDVLGVSWGGALAQEFARRHLDRVRKLVLMATTPGVVSFPGSMEAMWALATPRRYYSNEYFWKIAPILYGGAARTNPGLLRQHGHLRFIRPPTVRGYLWQLLALSGWSSLSFLRHIDRPTLVMAADDDPIIPLANARIIAGLLPKGRLEVVRNGGHLFLITHADQVAPVLEKFLAEDAPSAAATVRHVGASSSDPSSAWNGRMRMPQ
jgi:poly(3-hydroxyalkanoate) depolymerase